MRSIPPSSRTLPLAPVACAISLIAATALTAQDAASTFGHARTRHAAALGRLPTPLEVAVADIVNYHRHRLPIPRGGQAVALDLRAGAPAVRPGGTCYLQIGFTTTPPSDRRDRPPLSLALVVDTSGSMGSADKLTEVKAGLHRLANHLRPEDRVALVAYAQDAALVAPSQPFGEGAWFDRAVASLQAQGGTNLHAGLMRGLREVSHHQVAGGSHRVILLTDGIANIGETDPETILSDASAFTSEGIDLSTIGLGEDLNTDLLDRLARGGRGLFHFVTDVADLTKVFVDEVDMLLSPVARGASVRLELPAGLRLARVYGHAWEHQGPGAIRIDLPDMNAGLTSVVMVRCSVERQAAYEGEGILAVRAVLEARNAIEHTPLRETATVTLGIDPFAGEPLADVSVRKNQTIALLAQGMHDMAREAADRRWVAADRHLRAALTTARQRFPSREDVDVRAVLEMAESHERTLLRHIDRFDRD